MYITYRQGKQYTHTINVKAGSACKVVALLHKCGYDIIKVGV